MISIFAGLIELIAKWMVGNKNKWGWVLHFFSGLIWAYVAIKNPAIAGGLLIIVVPSFVLNIKNFVQWHRGEKYDAGI